MDWEGARTRQAASRAPEDPVQSVGDWTRLDPTAKQLAYIDHLATAIGVEYDVPTSRGEAAQLIQRLRFARGKY
jgi:hypothetical protein